MRPQIFKQGFRVFVMALAVFAIFSLKAFAEMRHQSGNLFWMDVPQEWQWSEDHNSVTVMSSTGNRAIRIDFEVADGIHSDADAAQAIQQAMASEIQEVASRNGKAIMRLERKIDGVPALQSNFLISAAEGMRQATAIVFFKGRHLYGIYLEAPREFQRIEMEKIVDTLKLEAPKPESDEAANSPVAGSPEDKKTSLPEVANQVEVSPKNTPPDFSSNTL